MKKLLATLILALSFAAAGAQAPQLSKIDPPNWFAQLPAPMLLVRGEHLSGAIFSISDAHLRIKRSVVSANGHWAQIFLSASPARPQHVVLRAARGGQIASMPYEFAARRQPSNGPSGFSSRDVMYLIMTDRFADGDPANDGADGHQPTTSGDAAAERAKPRGWHGGDLRGVTQHLDYLQSLGVTTVWTTPVYQNHEFDSYHGYGATDMFAVDEHYGSLADLQALGAELRRRGMKLVLDTVPNHVGPKNPWVEDEPSEDWFHGTKARHTEAESNFSALIDPNAAPRDRVGTLHGWFGDALPDMNTESPAVAQYLRQNIVWWIEETGADALRIDTFPYVDRHFWAGLHTELTQLYPRLTDVGEIFNANAVITSSFAGGVTRAGEDTGLYTPFDFPTYFALREVFLKGAPMTKLAETLAHDSLYPHPERLITFFGNHDTTRFAETASPAAQRLAFAYIMTTRGMPQIYSGDELAMKGGEDPDNRHDFPSSAFTAAGRTPEQTALFDWTARLGALRSRHPALQCGEEQVLKSSPDLLVYVRLTAKACAEAGDKSGERMVVALHRGTGTETGSLALGGTALAGCRLAQPELGEPDWATIDQDPKLDEDRLKLHLGPDSVAIAACRIVTK